MIGPNMRRPHKLKQANNDCKDILALLILIGDRKIIRLSLLNVSLGIWTRIYHHTQASVAVTYFAQGWATNVSRTQHGGPDLATILNKSTG